MPDPRPEGEVQDYEAPALERLGSVDELTASSVGDLSSVRQDSD
jgi:hypothetical protein